MYNIVTDKMVIGTGRDPTILSSGSTSFRPLHDWQDHEPSLQARMALGNSNYTSALKNMMIAIGNMNRSITDGLTGCASLAGQAPGG